MTPEQLKEETDKVDMILVHLDRAKEEWDARRQRSVRKFTGVRIYDVKPNWVLGLPISYPGDNEPVTEMFVSHDKPDGMRLWVQLTEGDSHIYAIQPHETVWVFVEQAA